MPIMTSYFGEERSPQVDQNNQFVYNPNPAKRLAATNQLYQKF